jgi:hypothetical protein
VHTEAAEPEIRTLAMIRDARIIDTSTLAAYALLLMAERRGDVVIP